MRRPIIRSCSPADAQDPSFRSGRDGIAAKLADEPISAQLHQSCGPNADADAAARVVRVLTDIHGCGRNSKDGTAVCSCLVSEGDRSL